MVGRQGTTRRRALVLGAALACAGACALPGVAAVVENRTVRVSGPPGGVADGESANPAISSTGRLVAFDSSATNITPDDDNGAIRDVFTYDRVTGERLLVSRAPGGPAANGPSLDPALAGPSRRVAFTSAASNLVPDDTNGKADVFVREGAGEIVRVSVAYDGSEANGDSYQPDISADGRFVVFTSTASNLVPDDTNGVEDVFIRDLEAGTTRRVSLRGRRGQANGRSGTPAISPDGRYVSFESEATNLAGRDRNRVADVFLRDVSAGKTVRVSNAWNGRQQNAAVAEPFRMVSDVSRGGRYVVFESDASNLVKGDTNRDTDVFVVDRRRKTIERISVSTRGLQGNNDSFAPTITPNGRFVAFQSFASNLAPNGAAREDIFVHDRRRGVTVLGSVSTEGTARGPERTRQLLQEPALSDKGTVVAFISGADNLTPGDTNGLVDVFVRDLTPPHGTIAGKAPRAIGPKAATVEVKGDDPQAGRTVCRVDRGPLRECGYPHVRMPRNLADGRHRLTIHVGGPGMLFDPTPIRLDYTVDRSRPGVVLDRPATPLLASLTTIRGRAGDRVSGVERVEVAVVESRDARTCRVYDGRRFVKARSCKSRRWVDATGARKWRLRLRQRPRGFVFIQVRAVDRAGNVSRSDRRLVLVR